MSELELGVRVAKAISEARRGYDEWNVDDFELARAALEAIGIDEILEVLRPFTEKYLREPEYYGGHGTVDIKDIRRAGALYKTLDGK